MPDTASSPAPSALETTLPLAQSRRARGSRQTAMRLFFPTKRNARSRGDSKLGRPRYIVVMEGTIAAPRTPNEGSTQRLQQLHRSLRTRTRAERTAASPQPHGKSPSPEAINAL